MKEFNVVNIVFSSSATVYGTPDYLPIDEKHPVGRNLTNCYGRTKYFLEQVLTDVYSAEKVKKNFNSLPLRNLPFEINCPKYSQEYDGTYIR